MGTKKGLAWDLKPKIDIPLPPLPDPYFQKKKLRYKLQISGGAALICWHVALADNKGTLHFTWTLKLNNCLVQSKYFYVYIFILEQVQTTVGFNKFLGIGLLLFDIS